MPKVESHEEITFEDMCETKSVTGALYLDMNENLPDVAPAEKDLADLLKRVGPDGIVPFSTDAEVKEEYRQQGGELGADDYIPMKKPKDLYIITTARKRDTCEWGAELASFSAERRRGGGKLHPLLHRGGPQNFPGGYF